MFRAVDRQGNDFVSIDFRWDDGDQLDLLRQMGRSDELRCPWCKVAVLLKAGEIRVRHFAHKIKNNCPYKGQAEDRLLGRMLLYRWLVAKVGRESVRIEVDLPGVELPEPFDVVVNSGTVTAAYWFLPKNIHRIAKREEFQGIIRSKAGGRTAVHVVHSARLHAELDHDEPHVHLTPTHEYLNTPCVYDEPHEVLRYGFGGGTMQALDLEEESLMTFRGLRQGRWEHQFRYGEKLVHPLAEMLIQPPDGELVHPGEHERLMSWREAKGAREARESALRAEHEARLAAARREYERRGQTWAIQGTVGHDRSRRSLVERPPEKPPRPCEICGEMTPERDWVIYTGNGTTCKCRSCMGARRSRS